MLMSSLLVMKKIDESSMWRGARRTRSSANPRDRLRGRDAKGKRTSGVAV